MQTLKAKNAHHRMYRFLVERKRDDGYDRKYTAKYTAQGVRNS